jgi:hypothetical protein
LSADRRLPSALIGLLAVVLVTTGLAWGFLGLSLRSLESVFHDRVEALALLHTVNDDMSHTLVDMAVKVDRGLVSSDSALVAVRGARERAESSWDAYLKTWFTPAESTLVVQITPTIQHGFVVAQRLQDTLTAPDRASLTQFINGDFFPAFDAFSQSLRELVALQVRVTREAYTVSRARFGVARQAFLGAIVAACVLVMVALLAGTRRTTSPVRRWTR